MRLRVDTQESTSFVISASKRDEITALLRVIKGNTLKEMVEEDSLSFEDFVIQKLNDIYSFQLKQEQKSTQLLSTIAHISKGDFTRSMEEPLVDKDNLDLIQKGIAQLGGKLQENVVKSNTFDVLFDSISLPFLLLNVLDRTITNVNAAAVAMFNLDLSITKTIPSFMCIDTSLMAIIDSFYLFEDDSFTFEYTFSQLKGKPVIIHLSKVTNVFDSKDQIAIFITDISIQKENEFKNKERAIQQRSLKLKQDFLTAIDKEMMQPLATISKLIPKGKIANFRMEDIHELLNANVLLKHAVENIQVYNDLNGSILNCTETNVLVLVEKMLQNHYFHAIAKNVFLDYEVDSSIPDSLSLDADKLALVLNNLVANSLKFSTNNSIKVNVELETNNRLKFIISDNLKGIGNANEIGLENIYSRLETPSLSGVETGDLGLIVSAMLVEYLGGELKQDEETKHLIFSIPFSHF